MLYRAGPAGGSVREISRCTGADVKSWTSPKDRTGPGQTPRDTRVFVIEVRCVIHRIRRHVLIRSVCILNLLDRHDCIGSQIFTAVTCCRARERLLWLLLTSSSPRLSSTRTFAKAPSAVRPRHWTARTQKLLPSSPAMPNAGHKLLVCCGCAGKMVARIQRVMGVEFIYQPPPRTRVPFAAALKTPAVRPCASPLSVRQTPHLKCFVLVGVQHLWEMALGRAYRTGNFDLPPHRFMRPRLRISSRWMQAILHAFTGAPGWCRRVPRQRCGAPACTGSHQARRPFQHVTGSSPCFLSSNMWATYSCVLPFASASPRHEFAFRSTVHLSPGNETS